MIPTSVSQGGLADAFVSRLAGFVSFLRARGVAVGVGAELDLGRALNCLPLLDRDSVLGACRVALAKSPADLIRIEEAFDLYWSSSLPIQASGPSSGGVIPRPPPPDAAPSREPPSRSPPLAMDPTGIVRVGVYSPDAPPAGHSLAAVTPRRLATLRAGARRFRRFAATLPGRRSVPSPRGRIDFPATARNSLRQGGEWIEVRRRERKRQRSELMILWDVSGSMSEHDSTLFALAYTMQRVSRRSRVFAFSTDLEDLSERVRARTYPRAAEAIARSLRAAGGGTRIGRCLQEFNRRYGGWVRPTTTVVILSDGWDLGETDVLRAELDRLRRRSHRIVWVNPYARDREFRPATAAMREALPYVDALLAPEDFESARPFRTIRGAPAG